LNYRHGFHAGNFADVLKHATLVAALGRLKEKPKPFAVIETHAGRGLYDLGSDAALRSGEFRSGISRVLNAGALPPLLGSYAEAVRALQNGNALLYPGSPLLAAAALRPGDRYAGAELHPEEASALRAALNPWKAAGVREADGYRALRSLLPPPERRGLVLIDPPFEKTSEFADLAAALIAAWTRFPAGACLVWLPLKDRGAAAALEGELVSAGLRDLCAADLFVRDPDAAPGMAGCGLLLVNLSFALEAPLTEALAWMAVHLATGPGARAAFRRLTRE
jgi:23S rRNA (adenine2030-N6)-methyltransferase